MSCCCRTAPISASALWPDSALGSFVAEQNVYNPIKEQEEMFRMATGLDDALYTNEI